MLYMHRDPAALAPKQAVRLSDLSDFCHVGRSDFADFMPRCRIDTRWRWPGDAQD